MNSKINLRKERGHTQLLYVRDIKCINNNHKRFQVLGNSGKTYTVDIKSTPTCSCPDFQTRYVRCKHIFYVFEKILRVNEKHCYNKKYNDKELSDMLGNSHNIKQKCVKHNNTNKINNYIIIEDYAI